MEGVRPLLHLLAQATPYNGIVMDSDYLGPIETLASVGLLLLQGKVLEETEEKAGRTR